MILCLVTDRRRVPVVDQVSAAVAAGIDVVQVREPDMDTAHLAALVREVVRAARGTPTRVVVNDRLDVALACRADGVHLRADSISASRARTLLPKPLLVGRSVHGADDARGTAASVDYLIAGTVFPTASKPGVHPLLGLEGLRSIVSAAAVPVLAIGGVSLERLASVAETGAAGIAAIGLFSDVRRLREIVREARQRFDSVGGIS